MKVHMRKHEGRRKTLTACGKRFGMRTDTAILLTYSEERFRKYRELCRITPSLPICKMCNKIMEKKGE